MANCWQGSHGTGLYDLEGVWSLQILHFIMSGRKERIDIEFKKRVMSVLVKATNIVSPLGFSTEENFSKILARAIVG